MVAAARRVVIMARTTADATHAQENFVSENDRTLPPAQDISPLKSPSRTSASPVSDTV